MDAFHLQLEALEMIYRLVQFVQTQEIISSVSVNLIKDGISKTVIIQKTRDTIMIQAFNEETK